MGGGRGGKTADVPDPAVKEEDAAASPLMASGGGKGVRTRCGVATAAATAGPSVPKPVAVGQRPSPLGAACASAAGSGGSEIAPWNGRSDRPRHKSLVSPPKTSTAPPTRWVL